MTDWTLHPCLSQVAALTEIDAERRATLRDGPDDHATYRAALNTIPALQEVEVGGPAPLAAGATGHLRVVAWNVERLRYLQPVADTLTGAAADVCLLTEIDKGMARTGNTHRTAELAALIGQGYAYGAEFIELDRGTTRERNAHADTENALGFHGNAVLSRLALQRPALFRLETEGKWFGWDRDEPRVGGRLAIGGQVLLDRVAVTLVAVHLESHSDPDHRAGQVARLMDLIDLYDPNAPLLIGGDFNTSTMGRGPAGFARPDLRDDPLRLLRVEPYEPLFAMMAARGFDWTACNVPDAPTQRFPGADMPRPLGKIDWIFTRGLLADEPTVLPALCPDGTPSSDHEGLFVRVRLAQN
jgi:endonuclease/exonuclease/phosphatase family metal-dependent hydrolase